MLKLASLRFLGWDIENSFNKHAAVIIRAILTGSADT